MSGVFLVSILTVTFFNSIVVHSQFGYPTFFMVRGMYHAIFTFEIFNVKDNFFCSNLNFFL